MCAWASEGDDFLKHVLPKLTCLDLQQCFFQSTAVGQFAGCSKSGERKSDWKRTMSLLYHPYVEVALWIAFSLCARGAPHHLCCSELWTPKLIGKSGLRGDLPGEFWAALPTAPQRAAQHHPDGCSTALPAVSSPGPSTAALWKNWHCTGGCAPV